MYSSGQEDLHQDQDSNNHNRSCYPPEKSGILLVFCEQTLYAINLRITVLYSIELLEILSKVAS
jgi:hypothetical protein